MKGHNRDRSLSSLNVDRQNQFLPGQRRDVTYVSRLQVRVYAHAQCGCCFKRVEMGVVVIFVALLSFVQKPCLCPRGGYVYTCIHVCKF